METTLTLLKLTMSFQAATAMQGEEIKELLDNLAKKFIDFCCFSDFGLDTSTVFHAAHSQGGVVLETYINGHPEG